MEDNTSFLWLAIYIHELRYVRNSQSEAGKCFFEANTRLETEDCEDYCKRWLSLYKVGTGKMRGWSLRCEFFSPQPNSNSEFDTYIIHIPFCICGRKKRRRQKKKQRIMKKVKKREWRRERKKNLVGDEQKTDECYIVYYTKPGGRSEWESQHILLSSHIPTHTLRPCDPATLPASIPYGSKQFLMISVRSTCE